MTQKRDETRPRTGERSRRQFLATSLGAAAVMAGARRRASAARVSQGKGPRKILALVASPRKGGNTDTLTTAILDAARDGGAATEKIYLIDQQIAPCRQCEYCHTSAAPGCRIKDDYPVIAEKMVNADTIVIATPIWWSSVHSLLKLVLDRSYSLVSKDWSQFRLAGKQFVLVACQGQKNIDLYVNPFVKEFKVYEEDMKIKVLDSLVASAYGKGEVAANTEIMGRATQLGKRLAAL